ncbi:MAG: sortase [Patescibacteria group bacterium]
MKLNNDFWADAKVKFVLIFTGVFLASFVLLYMIGFVPDELSPDGDSALNDLKLQTIENASGPAAQTTPALEQPAKKIGEKPVHISAPKVGIDIRVENPASSDNSVLNEYLTRGAVHYPGSADLALGNVFIFGHSSNADVVINKAYKAMNGISKLVRGDLIYVDSDTRRYVYEVTREYEITADEAFVDLKSDKNMLTLSTCDIAGKKQNRFVAEAIFSKEISL